MSDSRIKSQAVGRYAGSAVLFFDINLGLAPQALCLRLLSQAKKNDKAANRQTSRLILTSR